MRSLPPHHNLVCISNCKALRFRAVSVDVRFDIVNSGLCDTVRMNTWQVAVGLNAERTMPLDFNAQCLIAVLIAMNSK